MDRARAPQSLGEDTVQCDTGPVHWNSILGDIKDDMADFGAVPDEWFSERSLMEIRRRATRSGPGRRTANHTRRTVRSGSVPRITATRKIASSCATTVARPTFASDIAYHLHKRERGYDTLLDILGADHHGYVARVRGGLEAMGEPPESLEVELVQFVALFRGE